jgi:hypothetical protein
VDYRKPPARLIGSPIGLTGPLGYPIKDESDLEPTDARISRFEHGEIIWTADGGRVVHPE